METKCPFCNAYEVRESERDYPHWRQFGCGSLYLEEDNIDRSRKCIIAERDRTIASLTQEVERLRTAATYALVHVTELREAWMTGALSERDGRGGLRSNRNVDVEYQLQSALEEPAPCPET